MGCDRDDRDLAVRRTVAPEDAVRARRAVLGVGFEDLVVRVEGMLERTELVGLQAWMPGVLRQEQDALMNLLEEALVPTRLTTALARPPRRSNGA